MKNASISFAKNNLSAILRMVKEGGTVLLTDRNRPVAVLRPAETAAGPDEERITELVRQGIAAPARQRLDPAQLRRLPRPTWREGRPLTAHVAEDRESRA